MKRRGSSFPLIDAQRSEHVFVRTPGVLSWALRVLVINVETGALFEYAEKSGKKILKDRYNVKNCSVSVTDPKLDKELSVSIQLADKRILQLAFNSIDIYNQWLGYIKQFSEAFNVVPVVAPEPVISKPPSRRPSIDKTNDQPVLKPPSRRPSADKVVLEQPVSKPPSRRPSTDKAVADQPPPTDLKLTEQAVSKPPSRRPSTDKAITDQHPVADLKLTEQAVSKPPSRRPSTDKATTDQHPPVEIKIPEQAGSKPPSRRPSTDKVIVDQPIPIVVEQPPLIKLTPDTAMVDQPKTDLLSLATLSTENSMREQISSNIQSGEIANASNKIEAIHATETTTNVSKLSSEGVVELKIEHNKNEAPLEIRKQDRPPKPTSILTESTGRHLSIDTNSNIDKESVEPLSKQTSIDSLSQLSLDKEAVELAKRITPRMSSASPGMEQRETAHREQVTVMSTFATGSSMYLKSHSPVDEYSESLSPMKSITPILKKNDSESSSKEADVCLLGPNRRASISRGPSLSERLFGVEVSPLAKKSLEGEDSNNNAVSKSLDEPQSISKPGIPPAQRNSIAPSVHRNSISSPTGSSINLTKSGLFSMVTESEEVIEESEIDAEVKARTINKLPFSNNSVSVVNPEPITQISTHVNETEKNDIEEEVTLPSNPIAAAAAKAAAARAKKAESMNISQNPTLVTPVKPVRADITTTGFQEKRVITTDEVEVIEDIPNSNPVTVAAANAAALKNVKPAAILPSIGSVAVESELSVEESEISVSSNPIAAAAAKAAAARAARTQPSVVDKKLPLAIPSVSISEIVKSPNVDISESSNPVPAPDAKALQKPITILPSVTSSAVISEAKVEEVEISESSNPLAAAAAKAAAARAARARESVQPIQTSTTKSTFTVVSTEIIENSAPEISENSNPIAAAAAKAAAARAARAAAAPPPVPVLAPAPVSATEKNVILPTPATIESTKSKMATLDEEPVSSNPIAAAAAKAAAARVAREAASLAPEVNISSKPTVIDDKVVIPTVSAPKVVDPAENSSKYLHIESKAVIKDSQDQPKDFKSIIPFEQKNAKTDNSNLPKSVKFSDVKETETQPIQAVSTLPEIPANILKHLPAPVEINEEPVDQTNDHLLIEVVGVINPAHRLGRRVHIWDYSSGFSFNDFEDLHQFIFSIRESGDEALHKLSFSNQSTFLDWSDTMNALREQENLFMANEFDDKVQLIINVTFMVGEEKVTTQTYKIKFSDTPADIAAMIASGTGIDEKFLTAQIIQELPKENNFYQQGYVYLQNTMLLAEDLFIYQEEIIDRLSQRVNDLQGKLLQCDEALQNAKKTNEENELKLQDYAEKQKILDDMRLKDIKTKEEWEKERDRFIVQYQTEKTTLTNDLRLLRQSTNPNSDRVFSDLRRNEVLLGSLEDQLVRSEMANDQLKIQLQIASERISRLEFEKNLIEKHYQDEQSGIEGAGVKIAQFSQNVYYPIDTSSGESKENKPTVNTHPLLFTSPVHGLSSPQQVAPTEPQVNPNIRYYTPNTHNEKPIYNPKRSGGISSYFGDPHPYLQFSSDPADITQPGIPQNKQRLGASKTGITREAELEWQFKNPMHGGLVNHNQDPMTNDADNSTISNDDESFHNQHGHSSHRSRLPTSEINRMLASRQRFERNENHPLRQALRQELPQMSRVHKQKEEEKARMTPYQIARGNGDRYMGVTDSSLKKLRDIPAETQSHPPRRVGTAWKV